jgi:hypothetical protein
MALTNAEKQARWRARRDALARRAVQLEFQRGGCIFCTQRESDLKEDGRTVIRKNDHLVCETCITDAAAAIARTKARAAAKVRSLGRP